ncbi:hypothetical protein HME7025_00083 [Aquirufa nivalisilvae]|uniref:Peptidase S49 domain-containing protein n=1 Tax=Aquirufa nivalisilvae TaxID=2516557 RepID=A0A2S2DRJ0_9BACT|nr:S49 family peptidase [Aquirufa nivalisilvae]AWL07968.1 hypothetical protein HME7025_00083 [Aquirufa nivalisilvae]
MIENLISKTWALEPRFHEVQAAFLLKRINQGSSFDQLSEKWDLDKSKSSHLPELIKFAAASSSNDSLSQANSTQGVAVIRIIGSMTRYGGLCSYGSEDIASWILEANTMPEVSAIVIQINSPGGEVDGTEMLANVVKNSQKPIVAHVAGMAASAGYWVASQATEIMMESKTTSEVGSIGVLAMHVDSSAFLEKEGHKVTIIRADGSEDKALFNSVEPLSQDVLASVKADLNVYRKAFINMVKSARKDISEDVFSGKMFFGSEALKLGMADSIGYIGDAVSRAYQLSKK